MLPLLLAPLLAKLAESGLSLIGNAVLNKGKQVVEEKLGVSLDTALETDEGKQALLQIQNDHEEVLIQLALEGRKVDLEVAKLDVENTKSARDMQVRIEESSAASWIAKNFSYLLDTVIISGTLLLAALLFFKQIPTDNQQIANITMGALLAFCATIVNFHRGSSSSSKTQQNTIATMANTAAKG